MAIGVGVRLSGTSALPNVTLTPRKVKPIKIWAAVGAVFLMVEVYSLAGWIGSGKATPTPRGPTPIPSWHMWAVNINMVLSVTMFVVIFYWFIVRSWRREGRLSADGLLALVFVTIWWQDPLVNFFQTWLTYSTAFPNWGSWTTNIPGWYAPNSNLFAEPLIFAGPTYLYFRFGGTVFICYMLRISRARWPQISNLGLIMTCFACSVLFDLVFETVWLRFGFYTYAGAISGLTLFHGHYYQFPAYAAVYAGALVAGWSWLRYGRDDTGLTYAERGVDELRVGTKVKTSVRFLALVGACNTIFLVAYSIPAAVTGLYSDEWPKDITKRSYLTDQLCGEGTEYACPGPGVPVPRSGSVHLGPDGQLVTPE